LEELERQRREEEERRRDLERQAQMWIVAIELRKYIDAVEKKGCDRKISGDQKKQLNKWLVWANQHANRIDPLKGRLPFEDPNNSEAPI
jgi:hypothetical protein